MGPVYGAGQICKWCSLHYKYVNIAQTNWGKKRRAGQIGHTPEPSFIQGPHTPLIHHTHTHTIGLYLSKRRAGQIGHTPEPSFI